MPPASHPSPKIHPRDLPRRRGPDARDRGDLGGQQRARAGQGADGPGLGRRYLRSGKRPTARCITGRWSIFALPDGAQRTLQLTEESTAPAYEVDEAVTIAYDPERPDNARIKTSASTAAMWILPLIMGILGAASGATLFARWVLGSGDE